MKKFVITIFTLALAINLNAFQADLLTGDTKLSCEAILCLSSGTRPGECQPSLDRYFSIKAKKPSDTVKLRRDFLRLCPVDGADKKDPVFADLRDNVLPNVDSRKCTADYINANPEKSCVEESCGERRCHCVEYKYRPATKLPVGCEALYNHAYTDIKPKNVCGTTKWYSSSEWHSGVERIRTDKETFEKMKSENPKMVSMQKILRKTVFYINKPIKKECWVNE